MRSTRDLSRRTLDFLEAPRGKDGKDQRSLGFAQAFGHGMVSAQFDLWVPPHRRYVHDELAAVKCVGYHQPSETRGVAAPRRTGQRARTANVFEAMGYAESSRVGSSLCAR
jgi:hypothetical protein